MILNESLEVLASSETDFEIVRILVLAMKTAGDGASVSNLCPRNCCPFSLFANKWCFVGGFWFVKNKAINLSFKELFTGQYATSRDLKGKKTVLIRSSSRLTTRRHFNSKRSLQAHVTE